MSSKSLTTKSIIIAAIIIFLAIIFIILFGIAFLYTINGDYEPLIAIITIIAVTAIYIIDKFIKLFPYPLKESFWFWWLILAGIYLGLTTIVGTFAFSSSNPLDSYKDIFVPILTLLGFFTPIGVLNFIKIIHPFSVLGNSLVILTWPVLILWILFFDKIIFKFNIKGSRKIIANLIGLAVLTLIINLII